MYCLCPLLEPEAQSSEDVGRVLLNLAKMYLEDHNHEHKRQVPFNFGSSVESQEVLEGVRTHPTGWGGIFDKMRDILPPLPPRRSQSATQGEEL